MIQEQLLHELDASQPPLHIVRRLGPRLSHLNCDCPNSWTPVIEPYSEGQDGQFAVQIESLVSSAEERDDITSQVKDIDGSGGIAPYEEFGIVQRRGDLARSIAAACLQTGVRFLPNGDLQPPLFVMADPTPPSWWESDEFPSD